MKVVLRACALGGFLAVAVTCPNLLQLIPIEQRKRYPADSIRRAFVRLDKKGWLVLRRTEKGWRVSLTKRGQEEILAYELGQKMIQTSGPWDQKWRLLIFDIPEKRRFIRDRIRAALISFGFARLQDSIWIFPYECGSILELLRTKYRVRYEALYLNVDRFEGDRWLQEFFHLS